MTAFFHPKSSIEVNLLMFPRKKLLEIIDLVQKNLVKIFDKQCLIVISYATGVEAYAKCQKNPNILCEIFCKVFCILQKYITKCSFLKKF